jgi:hypothetical protein
MAVIKVPKTPKTAYRPNRKPSDLLLKQIEHLEWAALPAAQRKPRQLPKRKVKTEGQAAKRVAQLTALVLDAKKEPLDAPEAEVKLPPLPPATTSIRRAPKKRAKPRSKARSRRRS